MSFTSFSVPAAPYRFFLFLIALGCLAVASPLQAVEAVAASSAPARKMMSAEDAFAAIDSGLKAENWQASYDLAKLAVGQLSSSVRRGRLGNAVIRLAIAEEGLGRSDDARWHWQVGQTLGSDRFDVRQMTALGPVAARVAAWPVRRRGELAPGSPAPLDSAAAGASAPVKTSGDLPAPSPRARQFPGPKWVHLEVVVDAEGRATSPLALGPAPGYSFELMEAVRSWRFTPARKDGAAVPALVSLEVHPSAGLPIAPLLAADDPLVQLESLVRTGRFAEARNLGDKLWKGAVNADPVSLQRAALILGLRAWAFVGGGNESDGICLWQAAQGLRPELYDLDLSPYGALGAKLKEEPFGALRGAQFGESAWSHPETKIVPPRILPGFKRPEYTKAAKAYNVNGLIKIDALISSEGATREPVAIGARADFHGLDLVALDAVCSWRFASARLDGEAVAVFYELSVTFETGH